MWKIAFAKPILEEFCFESALLCQRNRSCVALKIRHIKHFVCTLWFADWTYTSFVGKSQCFRCEVKKGTKWSAAKKAEEGRRELVSSSPPTPLPHYWDCGRSCRHLTNLKDLPPNLNSVSMTSLSVAVILCPSERQSSVICFWFILPLPDLSYTENASLNSDKKIV